MALPPPLADLESRLSNRLAEALNAYRRAIAERLEGESRRLVAAISDLSPAAIGSLLGDADLERLAARPRAEGAREAVAGVVAALRALDAAETQAEALDSLLEAARGWADRVALVLVGEEGLEPWSERGFTRFASRETVAWTPELRAGWLGAGGCRGLDAQSAGAALMPFGATAAGAAVVVPLVLRDRIAALLWADRDPEPPELGALQLLVHAAAGRLELQALSARNYSPTLYVEGDTPGASLPLWSAVAPAAEPEPEPSVFGGAETAGAPAWETAEEEPAPEAEVGAPELAGVEEMFEVAPEVPPPAVDAVAVADPGAPSAAEEAPEFEYESVEEAPPAGEPARDELAATPEPEPAAPLDPLGTLRMAIPPLAGGPPARPSAETTAPYPLVSPEPPPTPFASASITHEIPRPEPPAPPPAAGPAFAETQAYDLGEDATALSTPRPPVPEPPPAPPPAAPPRAEEPMERTGARFPRSTEVAPPPDLEGPGRAFLDTRFGRSGADPLHDEAKRLARLLISEIKLYNEEQVLEGRRNRDLYHRLKDDIDRSRQIYDERVDAGVRSQADYFQQELVRSLAGGDPRALGI